jgi:ABC-type transporter MlaC component
MANSFRQANNPAESGTSADRRLWKRRETLIYALAFAAFAARAGASPPNSAEAFVQSSINRSYAILSDSAAGDTERQLEFRTLLSSIVDVKRVALFTLGPYGRDAGGDNVREFVGVFTDLLSGIYERGLYNYQGQRLAVTGSTERSEDDVIVNVTASGRSAGASQPQIALRVRRTKSGGYIITDLQIEGAWLALIQRAEFIAYLQQHGGKIGELSAELAKRAARSTYVEGPSLTH